MNACSDLTHYHRSPVIPIYLIFKCWKWRSTFLDLYKARKQSVNQPLEHILHFRSQASCITSSIKSLVTIYIPDLFEKNAGTLIYIISNLFIRSPSIKSWKNIINKVYHRSHVDYKKSYAIVLEL